MFVEKSYRERPTAVTTVRKRTLFHLVVFVVPPVDHFSLIQTTAEVSTLNY